MANNKQSVNEFLHRIFGRFDGSISKEEFRRTLTLIQKENVKPSEVDEELEKVDFDNDGKIDFKGKIVINARFAHSKNFFFRILLQFHRINHGSGIQFKSENPL